MSDDVTYSVWADGRCKEMNILTPQAAEKAALKLVDSKAFRLVTIFKITENANIGHAEWIEGERIL
jgi:hypothetical protein